MLQYITWHCIIVYHASMFYDIILSYITFKYSIYSVMCYIMYPITTDEYFFPPASRTVDTAIDVDAHGPLGGLVGRIHDDVHLGK